MKNIFLLLTLSLMYSGAVSQHAYINVSTALPGHPRLIMPADEEAKLKKNIQNHAFWAEIHKNILDECDRMITQPVLERNQIGKRILHTSKAAGRRIIFLSYAYRMTRDLKYAQRAEKEMLNVAAFKDWNDSHFLDPAEMTLGVAIGYDWLYDVLPETTKTILRKRVNEFAFIPSFGNHGWINSNNNWNQICHTGLSFGAVAFFEDYPETASAILNRAIEKIKIPMAMYAPDGVYPEGFSYWAGGTDFTILFLDLLQNAFENDYGLSRLPGFLRTAQFRLNLVTPRMEGFLWGDGGSKGIVSPAMFWFARKANDESLLWNEKYFLEKDTTRSYLNERFLPFIVIWGADNPLQKINPPKTLHWYGGGQVPVSLMRTSWTDSNAIYVGSKGGTASASHAHMDAGTFIMESHGIRWAQDFGSEMYNNVENAGFTDFWNFKQNSGRWKLFRYKNASHNTLTVNGKQQNVEANATLISTTDRPAFMSSVIDLSSVYEGQLKSALRGIAIVDKQFVVVRDELKSADSITVIRWNMVTEGDVTIRKGNRIVVTSPSGKQLHIQGSASAGKLIAKTWPTQPAFDFEAPNPGKIFVGFELRLPANTEAALEVLLMPEMKRPENTFSSAPLREWR